jgi:uncharacterized protein (DUF1697 family)
MVTSGMPTYIAMLRGINVSGHNIIKMEQLRASFTALGFGNTKTYIQSGNLVFEALNDSTAGLAEKISRRILGDFGMSVPVALKTAKEIGQIIKRNPFPGMPGVDHSKLHVTFLAGDPPQKAHEQLLPLAAKSEQVRIVGQEVFLYCPDGYGKTKLSNTAIEKKLRLGATTRNWKTVNTLLAMAR